MATATARNSIRPNSARRFAFRLALLGRPCSTCLLPVAWDGAQGDRHAGSADLAHRVAVEVCGLYDPSVIIVQCHTCNDDARRAGKVDLTADVVSLPYSLAPQRIVDAARAVWVNESAEGLPGATERRSARAARGLDW